MREGFEEDDEDLPENDEENEEDTRSRELDILIRDKKRRYLHTPPEFRSFSHLQSPVTIIPCANFPSGFNYVDN